jgi:hypothetical protein
MATCFSKNAKGPQRPGDPPPPDRPDLHILAAPTSDVLREQLASPLGFPPHGPEDLGIASSVGNPKTSGGGPAHRTTTGLTERLFCI